jgi:small-conductance mechanosensitive channel
LKSLILLFFTFFLYANEAEDILKTVSKDSPDYTFDVTLVKKINELKFVKPKIKTNINNQEEYLKEFYKLVDLVKEYNQLPTKITDSQDKLDVLTGETKTSKIQILYYKKLISIYQKRFKYLEQNLSILEKQLFEQLKKINFQLYKIDYWKTSLIKKQKEYEKLNIELQKWQLLNDDINIQKTQQKIQNNLNEQKNIYRKILDNKVLLWLSNLKNKNKEVFNIDDKIDSISKKIDSQFNIAINQVVMDFEQYVFGTKMLIYGAKKEVELTWQKIINILNYPLFEVSGRSITPLNFAIFVIILIIGWFIGKYYKHFVYTLRHKKNISYSTATLLANMGYYTILTISFLSALKVVGLDLSSLAIIAGALSVGIGFGLQNIVSNFVSGIILMFERSIKVGDYVQVDENTRGEVIDISMRSTIIRTNDNINLIIPNQSFIQNNVTNWTLGDDIVRFRVPFGVAYGTDIDKVERVILSGLENSDLPYIKYANNFDIRPYVVFMEMADSSLNFELFVWVKGEYARRPRRTRSAFLKMIYNELNKANITIPFPQQDIYIKELPKQ